MGKGGVTWRYDGFGDALQDVVGVQAGHHVGHPLPGLHRHALGLKPSQGKQGRQVSLPDSQQQRSNSDSGSTATAGHMLRKTNTLLLCNAREQPGCRSGRGAICHYL